MGWVSLGACFFSDSCSAKSLCVGESISFTVLEVGDVGGPLLKVGGGDMGGDDGADNTGGG